MVGYWEVGAGGGVAEVRQDTPFTVSYEVRKQRLDFVTHRRQDIEFPHFPLHLGPNLALIRRTWKRRFGRLEEKPAAIVIHFFEYWSPPRFGVVRSDRTDLVWLITVDRLLARQQVPPEEGLGHGVDLVVVSAIRKAAHSSMKSVTHGAHWG